MMRGGRNFALKLAAKSLQTAIDMVTIANHKTRHRPIQWCYRQPLYDVPFSHNT